MGSWFFTMWRVPPLADRIWHAGCMLLGRGRRGRMQIDDLVWQTERQNRTELLHFGPVSAWETPTELVNLLQFHTKTLCCIISALFVIWVTQICQKLFAQKAWSCVRLRHQNILLSVSEDFFSCDKLGIRVIRSNLTSHLLRFYREFWFCNLWMLFVILCGVVRWNCCCMK